MTSPYHLIHTGSLVETLRSWTTSQAIHRVAVLIDSQVDHLYPEIASPLLNSTSDLYRLPAGEACKTLNEAQKAWTWMQAQGFDRSTLVLAIGGGATSDFAGFVSSVFKRGLRTALIPTTLLAMVDAAFGGKTAINLGGAKNILGTFWAPQKVFVDCDFLKSLDERERRSGFAELLKYGFIWDAKLLDSIEYQRLELPALIQKAIEAKGQVVSKDPLDHGLRSILNFGHTLGHAIEALSGADRMRHGEAVAAGMGFAAHLSYLQGLLDAESVTRLHRLVTQQGLGIEIPEDLSNDDLLRKMRDDKKNTHGNLTFVLLKALGEACLPSAVPEKAVLEALESYRSVRVA